MAIENSPASYKCGVWEKYRSWKLEGFLFPHISMFDDQLGAAERFFSHQKSSHCPMVVPPNGEVKPSCLIYSKKNPLGIPNRGQNQTEIDSWPSGYLSHSHGKIHHAIKFGKPSVSMGHLYHGYVSHNQRVHIESTKNVCLKIGYIPNYSHLIGIMIINHGVLGVHYFQTHPKMFNKKKVGFSQGTPPLAYSANGKSTVSSPLLPRSCRWNCGFIWDMPYAP